MEIKFEKDIEIEAGNIIGVIDEDRYFYNYLENLLFNNPVITAKGEIFALVLGTSTTSETVHSSL